MFTLHILSLFINISIVVSTLWEKLYLLNLTNDTCKKLLICVHYKVICR